MPYMHEAAEALEYSRTSLYETAKMQKMTMIDMAKPDWKITFKQKAYKSIF